MKYECVTAMRPIELDVVIEDMILLGWVPQGGVSVAIAEDDTVYAQAMIKKEKVNE